MVKPHDRIILAIILRDEERENWKRCLGLYLHLYLYIIVLIPLIRGLVLFSFSFILVALYLHFYRSAEMNLYAFKTKNDTHWLGYTQLQSSFIFEYWYKNVCIVMQLKIIIFISIGYLLENRRYFISLYYSCQVILFR